MKLNQWLLVGLCMSVMPTARSSAAPQGESKNITITATVEEDEEAKESKATKGAADSPASSDRKSLRLQFNKGPVVMLKRFSSRDESANAGASDSQNEQAGEGSSKAWLGISLKEIEGDLATYLGSSDGVFVDSVFPNSPAAEARLQAGDILVSFEGRKIIGPRDLHDSIQAIKPSADSEKDGGKVTTFSKVTLTVLRRGKEETIELTPRQRPNLDRLGGTVEQDLAEGAKIFKFGQPGDAGLELMTPFGKTQSNIHIVTKEDGKETNVRIQINGEGPAKIFVTEDNKERELTKDQLDQLPEKARDAVRNALQSAHWFQFKSSDPAPADKGAAEAGAGTEQAFDEIKAQLEKAMKRVGGENIELELKDLSESIKGLEKGRVIVIDPANLPDARKLAEDAQAMAKKWAEAGAKQARGFANVPEEIQKLRQQVDELKQQIEELRDEVKASKK